jgi:hypothetical protein
MARTDHLTILQGEFYDLCLYFEQVVRNFSRYHKIRRVEASRADTHHQNTGGLRRLRGQPTHQFG